MLNVTLNDRRVIERALKRFPERAAQIFEEKLESGARVLAVSMARTTLPFGDGKTDGDRFMGTISKEIFDYFSAGRTYEDIEKRKGKQVARAFWMIYKDQDWPKLRRFLKSLGGDFAAISVRRTVPKEVHQSARNFLLRGHLPRWEKQKVLVTNQEAIKRFAKKKGRTVGAAKASWMAAAKAASPTGRVGKGMPAWANTGRHKNASGSVTYTGSNRKRVATVRSHCPWAEVAIVSEKSAIAFAKKRLEKALVMAIRAEERKLNRMLRA